MRSFICYLRSASDPNPDAQRHTVNASIFGICGIKLLILTTNGVQSHLRSFRTKMCPTQVRLVVMRTRHEKSKPFRYFCVYTTDLTLDLCQIVRYYRKRWLIETAFRDAKQHFGFDKYRVKSRKSINRLVQLSFVATCITQLIFNATSAMGSSITVQQVCKTLGINWYRPTKLTRGLMVQYLCAFIEGRLFSQTNSDDYNSNDIQQTLDNAA